MQAIVKSKPEKGIWLKDVPEPGALKADHVRVKVSHAGICGTDLHIYKWDDWSKNRVNPPVVLGHEFMGTVAEVGEHVQSVKKGQRVSAESHIICNTCRYCRTGLGHLCENTQIIGVDIDGAFRPYIDVPAQNIWPVHNDIPDHHAAIFDPVGNAMHTVMATPIAGKDVLVTGAGAIGLIAIAIARTFGAHRIFVMEPVADKRKLAEKLGADVAFDPADAAAVKNITNSGDRPQILLEMSGHPAAINSGLDILCNGGDAVMLGIPAKDIPFDLAKRLIFKGIKMQGIIGRKIFETWYQMEAFMRTNPKAMDTIISDIMAPKDIQKAFDKMEAGQANKVVLKF